MAYKEDFRLASSEQIERALCKRLEEVRLSQNITQSQMADEAMVSLRTIGRMAKGEGISLDTFIRLLKVLDLEDRLALLIPEPMIEPMVVVSEKPVNRKRARSSTKKTTFGSWVWGDEK